MCSPSRRASPTPPHGTRKAHTLDSFEDALLTLKLPQLLESPLHSPDPRIAPQEQRDIIESNLPHHTAFHTPQNLLPPKSDPGEGGEPVRSLCLPHGVEQTACTAFM